MTNRLQQDLKALGEQSVNFPTLFHKAESIIDYFLDNKLDIEDVLSSLKIIGGSSFSKMLVYVLLKSSSEEGSLFSEEDTKDVNVDLIEHFKFIKAKYGKRFINALKKHHNEHGWASLNYNFVVDNANENFIEVKISKNNNEVVYIKDGFEEMVYLSEEIVSSLKEVYERFEFEEKDEVKILEQITSLKETVISLEELLKNN